MSISDQEVRGIARLAKLAVGDDDIAELAKELAAILDFVAVLDQADTDDIEPMAHPLDVSARLRADEVTEVDARDAFQAVAPATGQGLYLVPQVIE